MAHQNRLHDYDLSYSSYKTVRYTSDQDSGWTWYAPVIIGGLVLLGWILAGAGVAIGWYLMQWLLP